jgi:hypothetical protein
MLSPSDFTELSKNEMLSPSDFTELLEQIFTHLHPLQAST